MCVDAVGGMRSEVCQGDVCGPRLETDNLWVNLQQLLPHMLETPQPTGSWILGSPSVMLPYLASVWSDFDQRHARTFLTPRADGHSLMDGNISARLPHRLLERRSNMLPPLEANVPSVFRFFNARL